MTFERFYSIIKPHKAASFNTVKRAKVTIMCIIFLSILFNIPHYSITLQVGKNCIPFGKSIQYISGQFYYWLSLIINFFLPFVLLLMMNSVIIHTLRKRSQFNISRSGGQSHNEGQAPKQSDIQVYVTLLLVTFGFLMLTAPSYALFVYVMFYDYQELAGAYAGYFLFYNLGRALYYTNYGINFFLYVISGRKFRSDLMKLFTIKKERPIQLPNASP